MYYNELYHHGILGQKWGVRRYQNPDGTLTKAGKKRLQKNIKYKDKLENKTRNRASYYEELAKEHSNKVRDLKKYGKNSKTYIDWKNEQLDKDFDSNTDDDLGTVLVNTAGRIAASKLMDRYAGSSIDELITENKVKQKHYEEYTKELLDRSESIKNMKVDALMSKKEIKKQAFK